MSKEDLENVSNCPAKSFMNKKVMVVQKGFSIKAAIEMFKSHRISGCPVVDGSGRIIGVVSEYDLLLQAATKELTSPFEYTEKTITVNPETTLKEVLVILYKKRVRRIPVVDDDKRVRGVISRIDLLKKLLDSKDKASTKKKK